MMNFPPFQIDLKKDKKGVKYVKDVVKEITKLTKGAVKSGIANPIKWGTGVLGGMWFTKACYAYTMNGAQKELEQGKAPFDW